MGFDLVEFKKEFDSGDLSGLEYLEKTLITEYKKKTKDLFNEKNDNYNRYDYIISLFYATKELNTSEIIYETTSYGKSFNSDYYTNVRNLLFTEIAQLEGFKVEFIYAYIPIGKYNDKDYIKGIYEGC